MPDTETKRVYVEVNSEFDRTGFVTPISIQWSDGRVFKIDEILSFTPSSIYHRLGSPPNDCYRIKIRGQNKELYFERTNNAIHNMIGRWYVKVPNKQTGSESA